MFSSDSSVLCCVIAASLLKSMASIRMQAEWTARLIIPCISMQLFVHRDKRRAVCMENALSSPSQQNTQALQPVNKSVLTKGDFDILQARDGAGGRRRDRGKERRRRTGGGEDGRRRKEEREGGMGREKKRANSQLFSWLFRSSAQCSPEPHSFNI